MSMEVTPPVLFARSLRSSCVLLARGERGNLLTEDAVQRRPEKAFSSLRGDNPGAELPRGVVPHVLRVSALQVGDPVLLHVLMKTDDATVHDGRS